jgi:hypothetical protein
MEPGNPEQVRTSEEQVEEVLCMIVGPLNRSLNRIYTLVGALWLLSTPVAVALLAQVWAWWTAVLGGAGGAFAVAAMLGLALETWASRGAAHAFNCHFPIGGRLRAMAVRILKELRTRNKAESRLQDALASLEPAEWVVRVKSAAADLDLAPLGEVSLTPRRPVPPSAIREKDGAVRPADGEENLNRPQ